MRRSLSLRDDPPLEPGDPGAELEALRAGAALADATDAELVQAAGPDAATFLHRLLASDVRGLAPGDTNETLLLSPQGRVLVSGTLLRRAEERFELRLAPHGAAEALALLEGYRFADDLELSDGSERCAPLALLGPRRAELGPATEPGRATEILLAGQRALAWRSTWAGLPALLVDAGPAAAPGLWRALVRAGARPVGAQALAVARVEAGLPLAGAEVDASAYPQEVGLEHAFALDKGCYVGQEVVAKLDTYGGLKRRLVLWRLADDAPVAAGTPVATDELADAGVVTSWVRSPRLGTGLALGLVKLRALRGAPSFRIGGTAAELLEAPVVPAPD